MRDEFVARGTNRGFDSHDSRLIPIELERSQEVDVLNGLDMPAGKQFHGGFREGFDAHYSRKKWRSVDLVVVQKGLSFWIEFRLSCDAVEETCPRDCAGHRSGVRQGFSCLRERRRVYASGLIPCFE